MELVTLGPLLALPGIVEDYFARFSLTSFYLICFGLGLAYALLNLLMGGLHSFFAGDGADAGGGAAGHDAGGHGDVQAGGEITGAVHFSPFSPISLATFITGFGGIGIIGLYAFHFSGVISALVAAPLALGLSFGAYVLFYRFFIMNQASSVVTMDLLPGRSAEVVTPIGADVPGEIAYVAKGSRQTAMAKTADGTAIPRGSLVVIRRIVGQIAIVEKEVGGPPGGVPPNKGG